MLVVAHVQPISKCDCESFAGLQHFVAKINLQMQMNSAASAGAGTGAVFAIVLM